MTWPSELNFRIVLIVFAALISYFCTRLVRSYVIRKNVMDIPNERSSHQTPTPRGGGLAVVFTIALCVTAAIASGQIATYWFIPLTTSLVISLLGWWDDANGLSAGLRLLVQIAMAIVAIVALKTFVFVGWEFSFAEVHIPTIPALIFFILFAIWMTNLYNFMDGIDGILGVQVLTVAIAAAVVCSRHYQRCI
jgi:Fuc2NAc and GlcNAc transferase